VKRFVAVLTLAGAATVGGLATAGTAQADPSLCLTYDINVNGQGQAGTQCLP
jgi:hypothetical protein